MTYIKVFGFTYALLLIVLLGAGAFNTWIGFHNDDELNKIFGIIQISVAGSFAVWASMLYVHFHYNRDEYPYFTIR